MNEILSHNKNPAKFILLPKKYNDKTRDPAKNKIENINKNWIVI